MSANIATTLPLGPLDPERTELLLRVVESLEPSTLQWLSGFAAGVAHERAGGRPGVSLPAGPVVAPAARTEPTARLTIVYGSQTGNSKRIADRLGRAAEALGLAARVYAAGSYPVRDLARERMLVLVVSTQGDGDPPDDARGFIEFLQSRRAPQLAQLSFSVLALGDSSYPKFCETGRQVDERLAALGARRLVDRVDCDVDYDTLANAWLDRVVTGARDALGGNAQSATVTRLRTAPTEPQFSREQPFAAEVIANHPLTGRGATREVRHLEINLAGSGLTYAPGDALGVWHANPPAVVSEVLQALHLDGEQSVVLDDTAKPLREWLTTGRELTRLTRPFLTQQAERSKDTRLAGVLQPGHEAELRHALKDLQLVDVLQRHPAEWDATSFVKALRPLAPRLYSIASSQEAVGEEAHLAVALVDYELDRKRRLGAASAFLASLQGDQAKARIFIEPNERFRLPADTTRDVIMIGPGTGVAPFRGFVQHRGAQGATGRNWLFFGARHFQSEFLYQAEWQDAVKRGVLSRCDLAFSRDRSIAREYVQDRLRRVGKDLYSWLENGAYLYVCGDAERMAPDVNAALMDIVAEHGGKSRDDADAYVRRLADDRRYLRDVY
ncbi:MAG: assimilatory sulfite reductase (NADPH) flavoprotein subunit [Gammaproteobacteria bacterium]|nr:assimilatory sulfite reductase (NADPH) flavoprotein subunit [Gammaproteobacteria bacterium]MDH4310656.1 assimilatory sulfite reductase (NADPH) flavoprotein subunit [Gammaproteobacteria bacterium]